jgi:type IV pilus assembly protein PilE
LDYERTVGTQTLPARRLPLVNRRFFTRILKQGPVMPSMAEISSVDHGMGVVMHTPGASLRRSGNGGFTLIELMITVAVVGILASVAVPSYIEHVRRSKLTDGTAALAEYRTRLEQDFQDNRNYGPVAGGACRAAPPATGSTTSQAFAYACVVGAAPQNTYGATATSVAGAGLGAAGDFVYTMNEANIRATTKYKGTTSTATCWLTKGSTC